MTLNEVQKQEEAFCIRPPGTDIWLTREQDSDKSRLCVFGCMFVPIDHGLVAKIT